MMEEVLRLLDIGTLKKSYLEKAGGMKLRVSSHFIKALRDIEDGICDFGELHLSNGRIDDEQVLPMIEALTDCTIIRILNLSSNNIQSLTPFLKLMKMNSTLSKLDLSENPVDLSQVSSLIERANENKHISSIDLSNSQFSSNQLMKYYSFNEAKFKKSSQGVLDSTTQDSISSSVNTSESTKQDSESLLSSRDEPPSYHTMLPTTKMSRMKWILHLKKVFDEIKNCNPNSEVTMSSLAHHIHLNISSFPLIDEHLYQRCSAEMGFSTGEILLKLQEKRNQVVTYDDILDAISRLNSKIKQSKLPPRINLNNVCKATPVRPVSTHSITQRTPSSTKNSYTQLREPHSTASKNISLRNHSPLRLRNAITPLNGTQTSHSRQQKAQPYFLAPSNKNNKSMNLQYKRQVSKDSLIHEQKGDALIDELYAQNNENYPSNIKPRDSGYDVKAFEATSTSSFRFSTEGSMSEISTGKKGNNRTCHSSSEAKSHSSAQTTVEEGAEEPFKYVTSSSKLIEATKNAVNSKQDEGKTRKSTGMESLSSKDSSTVTSHKSRPAGPQKNKSAKMLKQFLSNKIKVKTAEQIESFTQDVSDLSASAKIPKQSKVAQTSCSIRLNNSQQRPQRMNPSQSTSMLTDRSTSSARNASFVQNVPVTKVALGQNGHTPARKTVISECFIKNLSTEDKSVAENTITNHTSVLNASQHETPIASNKLHNKFLELLTNFNTFYNENASLLTKVDVAIINMLNNYGVRQDIHGESKIALLLSELMSVEIKDITIYPLLRTILSYVEVLRLERCILSQESFSELIAENLIALNLSNNNLSDLRCLRKCRNLEFVNISKNQITEVKGFIMCPNLKEIVLASNKIKAVKNLSKTARLRLIDLSYNQIVSLTDVSCLQQNKQLAHLVLQGNPVTLTRGYGKEVLKSFPEVDTLASNLQNISSYYEYCGYTCELPDDRAIQTKRLLTSRSHSVLNTWGCGPKGVLKNSASNINLSGLSTSKHSHIPSRSVTPSATRKTSFLHPTEIHAKFSDDELSDKQSSSCLSKATENILTISLDIKNLDS